MKSLGFTICRLSLVLLALTLSPVLHASPTTTKLFGSEGRSLDLFQYDASLLKKNYFDVLARRDTRKAEILRLLVEDLESDFGKLLHENVFGLAGLNTFSDQSRLHNTSVPALDFLMAVLTFERTEQAIKTKLTRFGVIAKRLSLGTPLVFNELLAFYSENLERLDDYLANLPQLVSLTNGQLVSMPAEMHRSLVLKSSSLVPSLKVREKINQRILECRAWDPATEGGSAVEAYGVASAQILENYFWVKKPQLTSHALVHAFWSRSYLRATYGLPLGKLGDLEKLRVKLGVRLVEGFASGNFTDFPEGEKLIDAIAWNTGYKLVLGLIELDTYEETLATGVGAKAELASYYRTRYMTRAGDRDFYSMLEKIYDPDRHTLKVNETAPARAATQRNPVIDEASLHLFTAVLNAHKNREFELTLCDELEAVLANCQRAEKSTSK